MKSGILRQGSHGSGARLWRTSCKERGKTGQARRPAFFSELADMRPDEKTAAEIASS
jgi:hypothetical protein